MCAMRCAGKANEEEGKRREEAAEEGQERQIEAVEEGHERRAVVERQMRRGCRGRRLSSAQKPKQTRGDKAAAECALSLSLPVFLSVYVCECV